jgi:hypothetical protein
MAVLEGTVTDKPKDTNANKISAVGSAVAKAGALMSASKPPLPAKPALEMHSGGPVKKDGTYSLKMGEHVLTEAEAKLARKHALLASGMKSLSQPAPTAATNNTKSVAETASKFKATKPAPSPNAPPDRKAGSVNVKAVASSPKKISIGKT